MLLTMIAEHTNVSNGAPDIGITHLRAQAWRAIINHMLLINVLGNANISHTGTKFCSQNCACYCHLVISTEESC
jgi:hypothetical protein